MNICTTCDFKYIEKGLCLYESLNRYADDLTLHWLCLDEKTYNKLSELNLPKVIPYSLEQLEIEDELLVQAKSNPPSQYGDAQSQYFWCLTPYFVNYILERLQKDERLLYCDSDIYFYDSPKVVLNTLDNKSVAIHTHRFSGQYDDDISSGWYNVGVMGFKKDIIGFDVSKKWKHWLLHLHHPYYEKYGTCGDQKYLNLFKKLWGDANICVFDEECSILHQAAWCTERGSNAEQKPLFYHFSHFVSEENSWRDSLRGEWNPSAIDYIKPLYEEYFEEHKKIREKYLCSQLSDISK